MYVDRCALVELTFFRQIFSESAIMNKLSSY